MDSSPFLPDTGRVIERRGAQRLQVDTHLDDLQSELEAGCRRMERIDQLALTHLRQSGITGKLTKEIGELRRCMLQQRATIADLRTEMRKLRLQLARGRQGHD